MTHSPGAPDEFDRVFSTVGGRLDLSRLAPEFGQLVGGWLYLFRELMRADGGEYSARPVYLDYIDNVAVNAVATATDDREYIGFYCGATGFVLHRFAALTMAPAALPEVGNIRRGLSSESVRRELTLRTHRYLDFGGECDDVRVAAAQAATTIVHFFLFGHELGHIVLGHLAWLGESDGFAAISEVERAGASDEATRQRHLLELDADMHGAVISLVWWIRVASRWHEVSGPAVRIPCDPYYFWAWSLGVLLRLFDLFSRDPATPGLHPAPDVRFMNIYVYGLREVRARTPQQEDWFAEQVGRAMRDLRTLWSWLELPAPSFSVSRSQTVGATVRDYHEQLQVLKAETLDPLARRRAAAIRETQTSRPGVDRSL